VTASIIERLIEETDDQQLHALFRNLGGHDQRALSDAFAAIDGRCSTFTAKRRPWAGGS
jgi:pyruvate dehydrogenase complex dehydrogenase (E1) component